MMRSPSPAATSTHRLQVRWDNFAILIAVLAVLAGVGTTLASQLSSKPAVPENPAQQQPTGGDTAGAVDPLAQDDASLAQEAAPDGDVVALVEEARELSGQGRWDEALDRLASVDPAQAAGSGAEELRAEIDEARATWTQLDKRLASEVADKKWGAAAATLASLEEIAPLSDEQVELREQIDAELAAAQNPDAPTTTPQKPKPAAARPAAKPAPARATTTAPAAKPRAPKPAASRPAVSNQQVNAALAVAADGNVTADEIDQIVGITVP